MNTAQQQHDEGRTEAKYHGMTDRRADVYADSFAATLTGRGDFWPRNDWARAGDGPEFDDEQHLRIFVAVMKACQSTGGPAERWAIVQAAVAAEAHKLADYVAGRA